MDQVMKYGLRPRTERQSLVIGTDDHEKKMAEVLKRSRDLTKERDDARAMVLRLVVVQYRDGWESGETEEETRDCAIDSLADWEMDPSVNREACKLALSRNPEVSLSQMRSNQELRESTEQELVASEAELRAAEDTIAQLKDRLVSMAEDRP